ncbi:MAG: BamA/TamA family outer membrane protein [Gemmatimonadetes bacterium]|nr:BamA/TamA family outer membrane protein [Gemmatimonadota bacterium]
MPGAAYNAGWLHRVILGNGYRDLWTRPTRAAVLNLTEFAGGLTPLCQGGGLQTATLRLRGNDGRQYVFRSVDKNPGAALLPPFLRKTFVEEVLQDQISSAPPMGALVVAPLLEAVGVLHAAPDLVWMPADTALGPYYERFAGILGLIEERPRDGPDNTAGFAGSLRIEGTEYVWEKIEDTPDHRVDARAFLTARLMDVFLGDWDRHYDQWRWARFRDGKGFTWRPIPRDRDNAFGQFDGLAVWFARSHMRQFVSFDESYPDIFGLTLSARALDRRFLVSLERPVWDSIAHDIQTRLTDEVIEAAVRRLPEDEPRTTSAKLSGALKSRRDRLRAAADRFYHLVSREVDVHATDRADRLEVLRADDSTLRVTIFRNDTSAGRPLNTESPYFQRTFRPDETREVRVYLHGGNDTAVVRGNTAGGTLVRIIGGGGDDTLIDSSTVGGTPATIFYDARGVNTFQQAVLVDRHRFQPPPRTDVFPERIPGSCGDPNRELPARDLSDPFRDWGTQWFPIPWLSFQPDVGVVLGMGIQRITYGFRKVPYASRKDLRAGFASGPDRFYVHYVGDSRDVIYGMDASVEIRYSGVDINRFHGFGNETSLLASDAFYRVTQRKLSVDPSLTFFPSGPTRFAIGPFVTISETKLGEGNFIDSVRPYGVGRFGELGAQLSFSVDTRNRPVAPTRGLHATARARMVPATLDIDSPFARGQAEVATYFTARVPMRPTLAMRIGGTKVWGDAPYHESAFLGGARTVRGHSEQRFAGDAAVYANGELRLTLKHFSIGDLGIFVLGDVGRVFLDGESSRQFHRAAGGGVWFAVLNPGTAVTLAVAQGERRLVYGQLGFMF